MITAVSELAAIVKIIRKQPEEVHHQLGNRVAMLTGCLLYTGSYFGTKSHKVYSNNYKVFFFFFFCAGTHSYSEVHKKKWYRKKIEKEEKGRGKWDQRDQKRDRNNMWPRERTVQLLGLDQISHVERHLIDNSVVECLDVTESSYIIIGDKVDSHTLTSKTTTTTNSAEGEAPKVSNLKQLAMP